MNSKPPERILVRGVNWLGDAVMSTPAIQRLKEAYPKAHLSILTAAKLKDMWVHYPHVDEVIAFSEGESVWRIGSGLRKGRFDSAVVFPNSPRSALEVFFAGIPKRIGYARPWRNFFLSDAVPGLAPSDQMRKRSVAEVKRLARTSEPRANYPESSHHVYSYLNLVGVLGASTKPVAPRLYVTEEEVLAFRKRWPMLSNHRSWVGINAGAEYGPAKRWPRFAQAARELHQKHRCGFILFGGKADVPLTNPIESELHSVSEISVLNIAGQTSLRELCVGLKVCNVVITNDSGPMHLAAALGTPVVSTFGSTSPELTGPGLPGDAAGVVLGRAPCAPCFLRECPIDFRCMQSISVAQVVEAVDRRLVG